MQLFSSLLLVVSCALIAQQATAVYLTNWWIKPSAFGNIREMISSVRVPKGSDPTHTYWCAAGFFGGYLGMQHNYGTERRFLFSVWDDGAGGKVDALQIHPKGHNEPFGGEGTGMHVYINYDWRAEETIFFRLTAQVNQTGNYSDYTGYYRAGDSGRWTLLGKYRAHNVVSWLTGTYSFLENYPGTNKDVIREGFYGNQTLININGKKARADMAYQPSSFVAGDVWEQRDVGDESYVRMDGPKKKGLYPATGHS
ncbi:hypothetical protein BC941DRAFT_451149 [Chlamydoabsidia padenii]|nr:hypothetical protein BC941DRAFT_451149 [Chlamydoabsidia padenii]